MEEEEWYIRSSSGRDVLRLLRETLKECRASSGALAVFDPCRRRLRVLASFGLSLSRLRRSPYFSPQGVGMYVFRSGVPVIFDALHAPPFPLGYERKRDRASVCFPLRDRGGTIIGILSLNRRDVSFEPCVFAVLEEKARKLSTPLEKFREVLGREYLLWITRRVARILSSLDWAMEAREVARLVLRVFKVLVPARHAMVSVFSFLERDAVVVSSKGLSPGVGRRMSQALAPLFQKGRSVVCDASSVPEILCCLPLGVPSKVLVCPFLRHGCILGAFVAFVDTPPEKFFLELLAAVGDIVAGILWSFSFFEEVRLHLLKRERLRISWDLHDRVAQGLVGAKMYCQALREALDRKDGLKEDVADLLRHLDCFLSLSHTEVRAMLEELRGEKDFGEDFSLQEVLLAKLDCLFGPQGVHYILRVKLPEETLPSFIRKEIFCILEECLVNVWKHAGATRLWVSVGRLRNTVYLLVRDNGKGLAPGEEMRGKGVFGLREVRERVASLNGVVRVRSFPGKGTRVGVVFPVAW